MRFKISSRLMRSMFIAMVFAFFLFFPFHSIQRSSWPHDDDRIREESAYRVENIVSSSTLEQADFGSPIRLKIPEINVDVAVENVGLTSEGAVGVPKDKNNAGWFELGPRPGNNGSAIIVGHYGRWKNGEGSVFDDLHKLRQGDKLYIEDDGGSIVVFAVRAMRRYDPKEEAVDVFVSNDGKPHLNIITCEGDWNEVSQSYGKRLAVFADRE